jgi:arginase family enzyme
LGTILPGNNIEDTVYAVSQVVSELIKIDVIPIIIGGGQDMTLACYKGFEVLEQTINICAIDHKLDIGEPTEEAKSDGFVSHLLMQRPCYLFNYSNIGMQRPKVKAKEVDLFEKLYFDVCRLGEFNTDIRRAEPHLRNADILSIDFNSINSAYTDQAQYTNPNGFRSDQICQIANYAGMSDKMSCFGIFEIQPEQSEKASQLLAEMIWYFADGVSKRVGDFPIGSKKNYKKFHVHLDDFDDDLVFYKSDRSERWWLEISHSQGTQSKYLRHHMVPCDLSDYENAMENVIPNLWWKTLQKIE